MIGGCAHRACLTNDVPPVRNALCNDAWMKDDYYYLSVLLQHDVSDNRLQRCEGSPATTAEGGPRLRTLLAILVTGRSHNRSHKPYPNSWRPGWKSSCEGRSGRRRWRAGRPFMRFDARRASAWRLPCRSNLLGENPGPEDSSRVARLFSRQTLARPPKRRTRLLAVGEQQDER